MDIEQIITIGIAAVTSVIAWFKARETKNVQDFFDPESPVVVAPKGTPARSYYMADAVRTLILSDAPNAEKGDIYRQIQEAEARMDDTGKAMPYVITFASGRWYLIEFGQIAGGGSPGAPIPSV